MDARVLEELCFSSFDHWSVFTPVLHHLLEFSNAVMDLHTDTAAKNANGWWSVLMEFDYWLFGKHKWNYFRAYFYFQNP